MRYLAIMAALLVASTRHRSQAQTLIYSIVATWLEDPEPPTTISANENRWKTLKENSKYLGLTFAGKAEFPFVVDIRIEKKTQNWWSVGNLVSIDTVFTCCRCIDDLGTITQAQDSPRVYFAQQYLFEYTLLKGTSQDWLFGGSRYISEARKHPRCNIQQQYFDGGLIKIVSPIFPEPPTITLMPITQDYRDGKLPELDLTRMDRQRRVCYVASFGRNFANIENTIVKDWKVRYRVYYEAFDLCYKNKNRMCPNRHLSDCNIGGGQPNAEGKDLMCFQARAKVGVVCDHDRGAPLVCDGVVFGLVILGAKEEFCNDLLQVPFWVQKVTMFHDYFEPNVPRSGPRRIFGDERSSNLTDNVDVAPGMTSAVTSLQPYCVLQLFISTIILLQKLYG